MSLIEQSIWYQSSVKIKKLTGKDVKGSSCGLTHILPQHFVQRLRKTTNLSQQG